MSDIDTTVLPIPQSELEKHYASVVPMQTAQAKLWRDAYRGRRWRELALVFAVVAEAIAIAFLVPNQHYVLVFSYLSRAGVQDTSTAFSTLPPDQRVAGIEALLWQYAKLREHYSAPEADNDYAIVSAMSAENVKQQYQKWANPKLNPNAPANKLGKEGSIRVYRNGGAFISHSPDYDTGVYQVRFCRVVAPDGQTPTAQRWNVSVSYQLVDTIPLWERLVINHAGVIVTEYPGPETEGAGPKAVPAVGTGNPCE